MAENVKEYQQSLYVGPTIEQPNPCPSCRGRELAIRTDSTNRMYHVECGKCGSWNGEQPSPDEAIRQWNNRPVCEREHISWIPTSERLPQGDTPVLIYPSVDGGVDIGLPRPYPRPTGVKVWWVPGGEVVPGESVTHWMPLPEPPTEMPGP